MKIIYFISAILLIILFNTGCRSSSKETDTDDKNEVNTVIDLKTSEKIEEYCLNIELEISGEKLTSEQINVSCPEFFTEIYYTKFKNINGELIKIETTTSAEDFYLMEDYYFNNNNIVQKYSYFETYHENNAAVTEKKYYFDNEKISKITEKAGKGINIDKAYQQFEKCSVTEIQIQTADDKSITSEITSIITVKTSEELNSLFCKTD
jgi:hypothetical protein